MACGKTVVVGGIGHDTPFVDKENCLLVSQASADALAEALIWAYDHRTELDRIGDRAAQTYQKDMSVAKVKEALLPIL